MATLSVRGGFDADRKLHECHCSKLLQKQLVPGGLLHTHPVPNTADLHRLQGLALPGKLGLPCLGLYQLLLLTRFLNKQKTL